jgi:hypothetical protein
MRATANPHERPVSGIQIDALNGENGTRCGQTASRWANGRFWWKLLFEAKLATTHIGREPTPAAGVADPQTAIQTHKAASQERTSVHLAGHSPAAASWLRMKSTNARRGGGTRRRPE